MARASISLSICCCCMLVCYFALIPVDVPIRRQLVGVPMVAVHLFKFAVSLCFDVFLSRGPMSCSFYPLCKPPAFITYRSPFWRKSPLPCMPSPPLACFRN